MATGPVYAQRVVSLIDDVDGNGLADYEETFEYWPDGRVRKVIGRLLDDGGVDGPFANRSFDSELYMSYTADGLIEYLDFVAVFGLPDNILSSTNEFVYNDYQLATIDATSVNPGTGLAAYYRTLATYTDGRLTELYRYDWSDPDNPVLNRKSEREFDQSSRLFSRVDTLVGFVGDNDRYSYSWNSDGTLAQRRLTRTREGDIFRDEVTMLVHGNGLLIQLEVMRLDSNSGDRIEYWNYDSNGRLDTINYDYESNGTIDVVRTFIWEDGICSPFLTSSGTAVKVDGNPYTGYSVYAYCQP